MKKIILLLLATYALMANPLPQRIQTKIQAIINGDTVKLANNVPSGMSGLIIHDYGNGLSAITHSLVTLPNGVAKVLPYRAIRHENMPLIKTDTRVNDRAIIGNFYNNLLLIAPNARTYSDITKSFNGRKWIHPDAYAIEFMKEEISSLSFDSLYQFALKNQVGLVLLVTKNRLRILDPISKTFLGERSIHLVDSKATNPFFSRFEHMDVSAFGFSKVALKEYYQAIQDLK